MSEKHTPEPWTVEQGNTPIGDTGDYEGWQQITGSNQRSVCHFQEDWGDGFIQAEKNAERIISCVNAMASIPDPQAYRKAVEDLVDIAQSLTDLSDDLIEVRQKSWGYDDVHAHISKIKAALAPFRSGKP